MSRAKSTRPKDCPYVGKGGLKLEFALRHFGIDVTGKTAIDLGCAVGGFTDCLLKHGAAKVYAVDTAYVQIDYKLRTDPRVVVCERSNALHWQAPELAPIIVIDLGWTRQQLALAAAAPMLAPDGVILSLVKPQYEADKRQLRHGVLPEEELEGVLARVRASIDPRLQLVAEAVSPILGSGGNHEVWFRLVLSDKVLGC